MYDFQILTNVCLRMEDVLITVQTTMDRSHVHVTVGSLLVATVLPVQVEKIPTCLSSYIVLQIVYQYYKKVKNRILTFKYFVQYIFIYV